VTRNESTRLMRYLANDIAVLRSSVAALGFFLSEDSEVTNALRILNRKQFEYQERMEQLLEERR
jgi:hypothetical protein